ncbi:MAG: DUF4423 domain-containing protein [Bdellovibrio sp.]|nr:DUF4423 domain-containing protein [Bdellovibrio sp.]
MMHNYREFILRELERRQKRNPSYSLRAFARDLEMPSSRLSEILNRKMGLSEARAMALAEKLNLEASEKEFFIDLALSEHARSAVMKDMALRRVKARTEAVTAPAPTPTEDSLTVDAAVILDKLRASAPDPSRKWDVSSSILHVKREQYAQAVEKIKAFRAQLAQEMEAPSESDSVYCLAVQVFEMADSEK